MPWKWGFSTNSTRSGGTMTTSEQAEREMGCMVLENEEEEEEEEEEDEEEVFEEEGCWRKPAPVPELRWTGCTVPT